VGCIIFELALGYMLFDTHSSHEHLAMIQRVVGKYPQECGLHSEKLKYHFRFFVRER
jgi:hypothetical protein